MVSPYCVVEKTAAAKIPHNRWAGVRADSRDTEVDAFLLPAFAERLGVLIELQGAGRGAGGMVRLLAGRAEQNVQSISAARYPLLLQ
jgi:hypothetical protein